MKRYNKVEIAFTSFDMEDIMVSGGGMNRFVESGTTNRYGTIDYNDFKDGTSEIVLTAQTDLTK